MLLGFIVTGTRGRPVAILAPLSNRRPLERLLATGDLEIGEPEPASNWLKSNPKAHVTALSTANENRGSGL